MGCLQSYFRKAHSTGLSPSPSAAAAAVANKEAVSSDTPPGSNGHAADGGSPPPRPPPKKKSHDDANADSTPPALPPKRASKASGESQGKDSPADGKAEERNGIGGTTKGKVTSATDTVAEANAQENVPVKTDTCSSGKASADMIASPSVGSNEEIKTPEKLPVDEDKKDSLGVENEISIKKDRSIEMPEQDKKTSSSLSERPKSTPVASTEAGSLPFSVAISPPGDPEGKRKSETPEERSKGEDISIDLENEGGPRDRPISVISEKGMESVSVAGSESVSKDSAKVEGERETLNEGRRDVVSSEREARDVLRAAIDVPSVENKSHGETGETISPPQASAEEIDEGVKKTKTSPSVSLDECGNIVVKEGRPTSIEETKEEERSFGFGDSTSLDTVVHVKTEGSTEIPSQNKVESASRERPVSLVEEETLQKVSKEMPVSVPKEKAEERPPSAMADDKPTENKDFLGSGTKITSSPTEIEESLTGKPTTPISQKDEMVSPTGEEKTSMESANIERSLSAVPSAPMENKLPSLPPKEEHEMIESPPPNESEANLTAAPGEVEDKIQSTTPVASEEQSKSPKAEDLKSDEKETSPHDQNSIHSATESEQKSELAATPSQKEEKLESTECRLRPVSATEEEVASVLLAEAAKNDDEKTDGAEEESIQESEKPCKDLPSPPPPEEKETTEDPEFPAPPDLNEDGEIQSPNGGDEDASFRTRSASFELVETLKLRGSMDEEGEDGDKVYREGRGLVNRPPTPVNADWPPSQEEDEEERDSISPEATATPSVTSESKHSLEEEVAAKLPQDNSSGSLKEATAKTIDTSSDAQLTSSPTKDQTDTEAADAQNVIGSDNITSQEEKQHCSSEETKEYPRKVEEKEEHEREEEKTEKKGNKMEERGKEELGKESAPLKEVISDVTVNVEMYKENEEVSEDERKEAEEVGRREVDEVVKMAEEEAERRDRESKMEGEGEAKESQESEEAPKVVSEKTKEESKEEINGEVKKSESQNSEEKEIVESKERKETPHNNGEEHDHNEMDEVLESAKEVVEQTIEGAMDAAATKIQATFRGYKTRMTKGPDKTESTTPFTVGSTENETKSTEAGRKEEVATESVVTSSPSTPQQEQLKEREEDVVGGIDEHHHREEAKEAAAAVKIQSTFRGYRVRRDAGKEGGERGEGEVVGGGSEADLWQSPSAALGVSHGAAIEEASSFAKEGRQLRREGAVVGSSSSRGSGDTAVPVGRFSGEFHDHVVLPPLEAEEVIETGRMREETAAPEETGAGGGDAEGGVVARGLMDSAAARIQAGYRGYRVRKRLREVQNNGAKTDSSSRNMKGSSDSYEKEGEAATKIQAGVRGFLTRRRLKRKRREDDSENKGGNKRGEEEAAVKIQAGFRGYKGRQKAKAKRQHDERSQV